MSKNRQYSENERGNIMNRLTKVLVATTSLLAATGLQALPTEQQKSASTQVMQRYTFTYDFKNTVHPVVKRIKEQQQYIQYDLVSEVQQDAHNAINDIGYSIMLANRPEALYLDVTYAK